MKIFGKELRLGDPEPADIVIFDECNSEYVRRALNPKLSVTVFKMRPYEIRIGPRVLFTALRRLRQFSLAEAAAHPRNILLGFLRQMRSIYFQSCLEATKPKAVLTFIDNDASFHWLSRNCRTFPFVAIQNGARLRFVSTEVNGYYLQHLFCWGTHEVDLFKQLRYEVENYYPVGSLLASLYLRRPGIEMREDLDLLIVSTWRGNIGFPPDVRDTMRSMKIMDQLLAKYVVSRNIAAAVILRAERDSEHWVMPGMGNEYDYYRGIYGDSVEIIEANFSERTIYPVMQRSELIVSCLSSALIEAYGIGKKVLFCNFTGTNSYHCDLDPSIVTDDSDWDKFSQKVDRLRAQPIEDYRKLQKGDMRKMMSNPENCPTHEAIARAVEKIIEGATCRA